MNISLTDRLEEFGIRFGTSQYEDVMGLSSLYISGVMDAFSFQRELKEVVEFPTSKCFSAKDFRLALVSKGFIRLKYFLLNVSLPERITRKDLYRSGITLDVETKDLVTFSKLMVGSECELRSDIREYITKANIEASMVSTKSIDKAMDFLKDSYPEILKHVRRIVYKKLTFVVNSTNLEYADLERELILKAIVTFYRVVPSPKGDAYVLNYIRASLTNHAKNMISSYTAECRSRLTSEKNSKGEWVSTLRAVSENQMRVIDESGVGSSFEEYANSYSTIGDTFTENVISDISIDQLLLKYKNSRKKQKLLRITTGAIDEEFTSWLIDKGVIRSNQDNQDFFYDYRRKDILTKVSEFLGVPVHTTFDFLLDVCEHLGYSDKEALRAKQILKDKKH